MSIRRAPLLLAASAAATITDTATLIALARFVPIAAGVAASLASLAGGAVNFLLSRRFVFRARGARPWRQAVAYAVLIVGCGALFTGALVWLGTSRLHASLLVAKLGAAAVVLAGWNYPVASRVVFARGPRLGRLDAGARPGSSTPLTRAGERAAIEHGIGWPAAFAIERASGPARTCGACLRLASGRRRPERRRALARPDPAPRRPAPRPLAWGPAGPRASPTCAAAPRLGRREARRGLRR